MVASMLALPGFGQVTGTPAQPGTQQAGSSQPLAAGANSPAESAAILYMRTAMRSEFLYKKKHNEYARSLASLVGTGSFTKRMSRPDRGDYKVQYSSNGEKYQLVMVPNAFDDQHRSFFVDQDGKIRVEEQKSATAESSLLKTRR